MLSIMIDFKTFLLFNIYNMLAYDEYFYIYNNLWIDLKLKLKN